MSPEVRAQSIEHALINKDLASLSDDQKWEHYQEVCSSLGLNPLTRPFEYIELNRKLVLYAKKDCTEQLRKIHSVSITKLDQTVVEGVVIFTAYAKDGHNRSDIATGVVAIDKLTGENRANAIMKAETKAKRRVTLSICGLGMLDETEVADMPDTMVSHIEAENTPIPVLPVSETAAIATTAEELEVNQARLVVGNSFRTPTDYELAAYKKRAAEIRLTLEDAGLQPSPGQSAGAKVVKFFAKMSGTAPKDMTVSQWDSVFEALDLMIKDDPKKVVATLEEVIK
jgi:hypothetical protein